MPQSLSVVYLHLIFSTKERRPFCCASMRCSGTNDTYGIEIAPLHAPQPLRG